MADRRDDYLGIIVAGWTMAFALPIGGFVTGFLLLDRRLGHGLGMIAVSTVATLAIGYLTITQLT